MLTAPSQLDQSYKEYRRIKAANGLEADLHEFKITEAGTALITIYDKQSHDMTAVGGSPKGGIWDSVFQEIDLETGELIFQWRASEHFALTDSFHWDAASGTMDEPFDFFHINSIEKDPWGNYLVSARYTKTVSYIDGHTGEVIWTLGGRPNQFTDLSDGRATEFQYQHDARWHDNFTSISIFNNGAQAPHHHENQPYSRGMKIKIDTQNMTAELDTEYINQLKTSSSSQGNVQFLPNGNVMVGYGYNGAFAEFAPDGTVLCEAHFGAPSSFHTGDVQSYRVMKFNWTGMPGTAPSVAVADNAFHISWNGATEVHSWALEQGEKQSSNSYSDGLRWWQVMKVQKNGFETKIGIPDDIGDYVRFIAVDEHGKSLGMTQTLKLDHQVRPYPHTGMTQILTIHAQGEDGRCVSIRRCC